MSVRPTPRLPVFACVLLAHFFTLLALGTLTRRHEPLRADAESLRVLLLPGTVGTPVVPPPSPAYAPQRPAAAQAVPGRAPTPETAPRLPAPDWSAAVARATQEEVAAIELERRQSQALAPPVNRLAARSNGRAPTFHWNKARTQRIEPLATAGTLLHLNDRCALVLFFVIPMAGCALGEIPARGDLFDHMHDATAPGGWKD